MTEKILTLSIASLIGGLFFYLRLPIPFMLGGIIAAAGVKFFLWPEIHWPARWRNLGLLVAGYGIGRNFTNETLVNLSHGQSHLSHGIGFDGQGNVFLCLCDAGCSPRLYVGKIKFRF